MHPKRVLTYLIAIALAVAAVSAVSTVVAPATASADTPCTGSFRYDAYNNTGDKEAHEYGWYWSSTGHVCIGQADLYENLTNSTGLSERVRVHDGSSSGTVLKEYKSPGKIEGNAIRFTTYVRRVFFVSVVTVCVAVIHQSDGSTVPNTIVCKSL